MHNLVEAFAFDGMLSSVLKLKVSFTRCHNAEVAEGKGLAIDVAVTSPLAPRTK